MELRHQTARREEFELIPLFIYDALDLPGECERIVHRAQAGQETIVNLGCLMLVALARGDAFHVRSGRQAGLCAVSRRGRVCLFSREADEVKEVTALRASDLAAGFLIQCCSAMSIASDISASRKCDNLSPPATRSHSNMGPA